MNTNSTIFMAYGDQFNGSMTYLFQPEDFDSWPNDSAKEEVISTITEILKQGYQGVIVESHQLVDGRVFSKFFLNSDTPEGRVVTELLAMARVGRSLPKSEILVILKNAYRYNGLTFPTKSGGVK